MVSAEVLAADERQHEGPSRSLGTPDLSSEHLRENGFRSDVYSRLDRECRGKASTLSIKPTVDIASEAVFTQMLRREVRRTERSGRPFMLALVSGKNFGGDHGPRFVDTVAAAISTSIRETDCLGWYEQSLTLGILLTEVGDADDAKVEL